MDPNTAWDAMLMAYAAKQWSDALHFAEALKAWLDRGGFPPHPTIGSSTGSHTMQPDEQLSRAIVVAACDHICRHCLLETSKLA
ncbi:hypothetical protein [Rubripirellula obstinata]|nr:hypothetical protein [Rubripirellula obstinata]